MKKLFLLLTIALGVFALSAQEVNTSMIDFNKSQYPGYLVNIKNASIDQVDAAVRNFFENEYNLKASKEGGFRAYLNQQFAPFGSENYDIYYNVTEFGKKNKKTTQLAMIVCTGNMNAVTSANNPDVDNAIRHFLKKVTPKVEEYKSMQEVNALKAEIEKLEGTRKSLEKEQDKTNKQIDKLKSNLEKNNKKIAETDEAIAKLRAQLKGMQ